MRRKIDEYLNSISTVEEVEPVEKLIAPIGPTLTAIKNCKDDAEIGII